MSPINRALLILISIFLITLAYASTVSRHSEDLQNPDDGYRTSDKHEIKRKFEYYGYYPSWKHLVFPSEKIPSDYLNGIFHAFIWADNDGGLVIPEGFEDQLIVDNLKKKGELVSISIGGGENSQWFREVAKKPLSRLRFISELRQFINENGYNGVDLDWEYPVGTIEADQFISFAKDIRRNIPGITLTAALPISLDSLGVEKIEEMQKYLDFVLVMAYDIEDGSDGYAGINAPLHRTDKMREDVSIATLLEANYISKGVPREKIVLGLPLYGRTYNVTAPYENTLGSEDIEYKDIPFDKCEKSYVGGPILKCEKSYVSYDDTRSIAEKIRYAKDNDLRGVFFWALGQDDNMIIYKLKNRLNRPTRQVQ